MSIFKKIPKSAMQITTGGNRVVTYEDWDDDGITDKVITRYNSDGTVKSRRVIYGTANQ